MSCGQKVINACHDGNLRFCWHHQATEGAPLTELVQGSHHLGWLLRKNLGVGEVWGGYGEGFLVGQEVLANQPVTNRG